MPRLLQNLTIKEVSSVKRGAGKGVHVLLMKMAGGDVDEIPLFLPPREPVAKSTSVIDKLFDLSAEHDVPADKIAKARKALGQAIEGVDPNRDEAAQQAAVEKSLNQCLDYLTALVPVEKVEAFQAAVAAITEKELTMPIDADLKKTLDALNTGLTAANATIAKQGEELAIFKMKPEHQEYVAWLKADGVAALGEPADKVTAFVAKFIAADEAGRNKVIKEFPPKKKKPGDEEPADDATAKAIAKALEDSPLLKGIVTENADLKKRLSESDARNATAEFAKKATDLGLPEAHGEVMRKAYSGDAEAQKAHEAMLKGIANQAATGVIFKEFGQGGGGEGTGVMAYDLIKQKAEELRKTEAGKNLSSHQARAKVLEDPLNKELVDRHKSEERARQKAA